MGHTGTAPERLEMFVAGGLLALAGLYGAITDAVMGPRTGLTRERALKLEAGYIAIGIVLIVASRYVG